MTQREATKTEDAQNPETERSEEERGTITEEPETGKPEQHAVWLPDRRTVVLMLLALLIFPALLLLGWFVHRQSGMGAELSAAGQRDVLLVYAPSPSAEKGVRNLLRDAALQLRGEILSVSAESRVYLLPADGKVEAVDSAEAAGSLLNRPPSDGTPRSLSEALLAAEAWADGRPDAAVVLLTDRVPEETVPDAVLDTETETDAAPDTESGTDAEAVPDEEGGAGPYDELDTPDFRAANAAYQAAASLSLNTPLAVAVVTMEQFGRTPAFTCRFCGM